MRILITDWALASYVELVPGIIPRNDYWGTIRPDVERLRQRDSHPSFKNANFWGPALAGPNKPVDGGFKMKWHNLGNGTVQLRLGVTFWSADAWLLHAWVKTSSRGDWIQSALMKARIQRVRQGQADCVGEIP